MASFQMSAIFRPKLVMWRIVLIIIITCDVASSTILDSISLLNLKKSFTLNNNALRSWKPGSDPCTSLWTGIICDDKGSVIGIRLENIGLSGTIDVNSLLNVRSLRTISFINNSFSGPIPAALNRLVNLKGVQLSGNHFSGSITTNFFDSMVGLKKLWLSYNNFTGGIPVCFGKLTNLEELRLENNSFSGVIPRMELPFLEILDLQNNKLQGKIPENLMRFGPNAFLGNPGLCGPHAPLLCNNNGNNTGLAGAPDGGNNFGNGNNANQPKGLKLGMMTVGLLVFGLCGIGTIVLKYKKNKNNGKSDSIPLTMQDSNCWSEKRIGSPGGVTSIKGGGLDNLVLVNLDKGVFGMLDLMRAGAEVMGHGLLGSSYKAMMGNGLKVVVKRVKEMNKVEREGFDDEMSRMGKLRHPNLLPLLGYQYRAEEKLLVSEFVPQGNLTCLLNNDDGVKFDWPARLKVVKGIAGGLAYLKSELKSSSDDVPHGNLKSSNVLIGPDFEPMLVDYGFNTLIKEDQASEALSSYKSPEASITHKVSSKSDVYCLGIIILEILTGKNFSQSDNIDEIREQDVIDSELVDKMKNSKGEMLKLLRIGMNCTNSDPDQRLDLDEAINKITNVQVEGDDLQQPHAEILVREEHDESDPGNNSYHEIR